MGTGKTRTAFVKASEIGTKILIVCPLSVIPQWVEELKSNGHRCDNLRIDAPVNNWGIINYESIWRKEPGWYEDYDTVIIDESQNIGNDRSKRTKYILKYITPNRNVILLSGTPDSGHYENLYTQLKALGWGGTKSKFYNFYVNTAIVEFVPGIKTRKITGYKNVDSLKQLCKNMGCDFLKSSECLELPEQIDIDIKVSKSRDYSRFKKDLIVTVNEEEMVGNSSIAEVIGLRKIASLGKKSAYCDLVKSTDKRLIVFYNFDAELNNLRQWNRLSEKTMYICNGKVKDVDQWKQDESGVLCVQYQAGATEELKQGEYSLEWKGYVGMNQIDGFICDTGATFYWDGSDYIEF
ncbi:unnamed protein product [Cylicocyclus nassatus]|uniref:Helicase ATP-binding domain-containing protein n=1 Tax=Cylicocyclus nassatus TaxID=53992 RepID=A0AA36HHU2_CYLNA|nr:unnamed protein product [Cylicocyclus nassatus]